MPDNVLFEGGAGETIRRRLLQNSNFHTLLRLPTGIFYKQGVKANVLFFDKAPPRERRDRTLWIYDLRTNQRFTLKERPMTRGRSRRFRRLLPLRPSSSSAKRPSGSKRFPLETLIARDKVNLDIFWLNDDALDDPDLLPPPDEVAAEVVESLEAALESFRSVAAKL